MVIDDPEVPGVVRIAASPDLPGPRIGILGTIHGNETCGLEVLRQLRREAEAGQLPLAGGTLVLIHGNPAATEAGVRFLGEDLNRILDYGFIETLRRQAWTPEHHRAVALRPVLEELDALLDLHSATEETPPFAIANDVAEAYALASRLGMAHVTRAWSDVSERVTIGVLQRRGRPGLSVECGRHGTDDAVVEGMRLARGYLVATGVVHGELPPAVDTVVLEVREVLKKPSAEFRFASPLRGLEELPAGHLIGSDGTIQVRCSEPSVALLPNDGVAVGDDILYLARRVR